MGKIRRFLIYLVVIVSIAILVSGGCSCGSICGGDDEDDEEEDDEDWYEDPGEIQSTTPEPEPPPDPCEGITTTDIDVSFTQTPIADHEYAYDASFAILACKEDISYKTQLESNSRIIRIASGFLARGESISDTYAETGNTDFDKVCVKTSDTNKQSYCKAKNS